MATEVQLQQSSVEEKVYPLDFSPALLAGITLVSVTVTHTPPSGAPVVVNGSVVGDFAYIPIPSGLVLGVHLFSVVSTTSNPDHKPEILLIITVLR